MTDAIWEETMKRLEQAQQKFACGDASAFKEIWSHREDVSIMGGFGGFERGWKEVGPRRPFVDLRKGLLDTEVVVPPRRLWFTVQHEKRGASGQGISGHACR